MSAFIIAEAGVNHNGNLDLAFRLAAEAKKAGADCIKFQTFVSENLVSKRAKKADYQIINTHNDDNQYAMLKKLELTKDDFIQLNEYCKQLGITFLSTAFDFESINVLRNIGLNAWKIPSGEITNLPYLIKIAEFNQPVIISTGMCDMEEVENAIKVIRANGCEDITLLHCTTEYPAPFFDVNLRAMISMKEKFNLPVGYSDHTNGIEIPIAAVALGASVIEKHFTLDKTMDGPDHKASLEPYELTKMVLGIRNIEIAMGDGIKKPSNSEIKNIEIARKSIIAKKNIIKGELLTVENITTKRPGNGISPMKWFEVLGTIAAKDFEEDEFIVLK